MTFPTSTTERNTSIRLTSILSTWTYLANTRYSSISIVLQPPIGKQRLANWFNAHLEEKEAIEQRQEAIRELSSELEFRQQFRLLGSHYKGKPSDTSEIKEWVNSPSDYRKHAFLRILPTAVGIINLLCIGATILGFLPASISRDSILHALSYSVLSSQRNNQKYKRRMAKNYKFCLLTPTRFSSPRKKRCTALHCNN